MNKNNLLLLVILVALCLPKLSVASPSPINEHLSNYSESKTIITKNNSIQSKGIKLHIKSKIKLIRLLMKINKQSRKNYDADQITILIKPSACQTITLQNGEDILVSIISLDDYFVSYVPCKDENGEEVTIPLKEVAKIITDQGDLLYQHNPNADDSSTKKTLIFSIASLVSIGLALLVLLGAPPILILFGPIAIVFSILAIKEIKRNPSAKKYQMLAWFGLFGGIIITIIPLVALIVIFILFFT